MSDRYTPADEGVARDRLITAMLLATPDPSAVQRAYHHDARFHATVRTLADIWWQMAPVLLEASAKEEAAVRHAIEQAMRNPMPIFPTPGDPDV